MNKQILAILAVLVLVLAVGCQSNDPSANTSTTTSSGSSTSSRPAPTPAPASAPAEAKDPAKQAYSPEQETTRQDIGGNVVVTERQTGLSKKEAVSGLGFLFAIDAKCDVANREGTLTFTLKNPTDTDYELVYTIIALSETNVLKLTVNGVTVRYLAKYCGL